MLFSELIHYEKERTYDGPPDKDIYISQMEAGYNENGISKQIVWTFKSKELNSFYSQHISGYQRLANGNTLVCSGRQGHLFEVIEDGKVEWEYINPMSGPEDFADGIPHKILKDGRRIRCSPVTDMVLIIPD